ncbi:hypothetical protein Ab1vBOLIVR5_gp171 [Agrobacterium phage OLIVR5]|uniref:Uncharacterized protein n=3 Tax=Caudoviricetes TaxID=2731619 RepID=A0A858MT99_9CAUD|nr:hypothetical protein KNU99_gp230 [Agrobacterium phage OLIVR5]QIW87819.1 hypothetical protein Ab1vBOLIVR5_gp171 [Agrobacterium phage OLIVR5]QIW88084.1 hypothetical protein Ab1vBOLIVR6_gp177 [Agrobacterium phage OLIVR6]
MWKEVKFEDVKNMTGKYVEFSKDGVSWSYFHGNSFHFDQFKYRYLKEIK